MVPGDAFCGLFPLTPTGASNAMSTTGRTGGRYFYTPGCSTYGMASGRYFYATSDVLISVLTTTLLATTIRKDGTKAPVLDSPLIGLGHPRRNPQLRQASKADSHSFSGPPKLG